MTEVHGGGGGVHWDPNLGIPPAGAEGTQQTQKTSSTTIGDSHSTVQGSGEQADKSGAVTTTSADKPILPAGNSDVITGGNPNGPPIYQLFLAQATGSFDQQAALVLANDLQGFIDDGLITPQHALQIMGAQIEMYGDEFFDETDPDIEEQTNEARSAYENSTPDEKATFKFIGSFMAKIAHAKALLAEIKALINAHDDSATIEDQKKEAQDLQGKLEVVEQQIKERQELYEKLKELEDSGLPGISSISKEFMATMMALLAVALVAVLALTLVFVFIMPLILLVAIPAIIIIAVSMAAANGAFGNQNDTAMFTLGAFLIATGIGAPMGIAFIAQGGIIRHSKNENSDAQGDLDAARESFRDNQNLDADRVALQQTLGPIMANLEEAMELEEGKMEFMASLRALLAVLEKMVATIEGGGSIEGENFVPGTGTGVVQDVPEEVYAHLEAQMSQAVSTLEALVSELREGNFESAMDWGKQNMGTLLVTVASASEVVNHATGLGVTGEEFYADLKEIIFEALATLDEAYDSPDIVNQLLMEGVYTEVDFDSDGSVSYSGSAASRFADPEQQEQIWQALAGGLQSQRNSLEQIFATYADLAKAGSGTTGDATAGGWAPMG